jgi:FMN phosphatase YigB (HAD superfamily)
VVARAETAPGRVLYVGDDPGNDLAGARAAGLPCVLLNRQGPAHDGGLPSLAELPQQFRFA